MSHGTPPLLRPSVLSVSSPLGRPGSPMSSAPRSPGAAKKLVAVTRLKSLLADHTGIPAAISSLSKEETAAVLELCATISGHLRMHQFKVSSTAEFFAPSVPQSPKLLPQIEKLSPALLSSSATSSPPSKASTPTSFAVGGASLFLTDLPHDLLTRVVSWLPTVEDIGRLDCVCRIFHRGDFAPPPPPPPPVSPVEEALRQRAMASGHAIPSALPEGEASWIQKLCWDERRRRHGERSVVAGGMYHSALIEGDGTLLTCGNSTLDGGRPGLLGHGEGVERLEVPTPVPALCHVRIRTLAAGEYHTLAIAEGGVAYSWGYGGLGRLGHGDEINRHTPTAITLPHVPVAAAVAAAPATAAAAAAEATSSAAASSGVLAAAAGHCHTLLLCGASGLVFSCGYGGSGRLGLGPGTDDTRQLSPRAIDSLPDGVRIQAVAAGAFHTLLLSVSGEVYSCGDGGLGQLGHGDDMANEHSPRLVEGLSEMGARVCAIGAGRVHSLCITEDGHAYSWGNGDEGRLGHGDESCASVPRLISGGLGGRRVCAISCVWDHSMALTDGGLVYSWGLGMCGQLGHGDEEESVLSPTQVQALAATKVVAIAAGAHHCFAVSADGCLFGWGIGSTTEDDQVDTLGLKLKGNQCLPVQYEGLRVSRPLLSRTHPATLPAIE